MMVHLRVIALSLIPVTAAFAGQTLYVDDDAPNDPGPGEPAVSDPVEDGTEARPFDDIQEAIDAATDGDTVLVAEGEYVIHEPIDFNLRHDPEDPGSPPVKNIAVRTDAEPERAVIRLALEPADAHRASVVLFESGESSQSLLEGFTLRLLKNLYGQTRAGEFGPRALEALRNHMIEAGLSRSYINRSIVRIRQVFRWAGSKELIPLNVYEGLRTLPGLKRGRSEAREAHPVKPIPQAHIDAVKPYLSRQVWALVQLQLLTAARSGELVVIRPCNIDTSGCLWIYEPERHKTAHREQDRVIFLGRRAQSILSPFLSGRSPWAYIFSPREAEAERRAALHARRRTIQSCGNRPGTNRRPAPLRKPGTSYTTKPYHHAIIRACDRASVPRWHPHQLRHNAATLLRKEFGIEVARIILGHRSPSVTDMYAEIDRRKAIEVMMKIG